MITVFGSINVDLVLKVGHLPLPGETVLCPSYDAVAGGKGANQALSAARAGAAVRMVGCVGQDGFADIALHDLHAANVELSKIQRTASPTACAAVMVDAKGENSIVVASGANLDIKAEQIPEDALGPRNLLILQMEIPHKENWIAIQRAHASGTITMLSVAPAAPVPPEILNIIDYVLVNEIEGRAIAEISDNSKIDRMQLPGVLSRRHGFLCIMTLGSHGAIAANGKIEWRIPALQVKNVTDTTGAGDAFAGCFAAAIARGQDIEAALRFANAGAGLSCSKLGAQPSFATAASISSVLP
jgi:ribokinase